MPQDFGGVIREFKAGKLHSGSSKGPVVRSLAQAKAIAVSEDAKLHGKPRRAKLRRKGKA